MYIIIIGCGKVGLSLAEQLSDENHDITLVDSSADKLQNLSDDLDVMKILGNGASISTLQDAGIERADILIAVTGSDELNLLCCLIAKEAGHVSTIARVEKPHLQPRDRFYPGEHWSFHDYQSGTGGGYGDFTDSSFSLGDQDRYLRERPGRASEIQTETGIPSGRKPDHGYYGPLSLRYSVLQCGAR